MTKDEALKLALEALETYSQLGTTAKIRKAVAAGKKALAQPQEVAVCARCGGIVSDPVILQTKREWVGLTKEQVTSIEDDYKTDIYEHGDAIAAFNVLGFVRAIEAKLKENNYD